MGTHRVPSHCCRALRSAELDTACRRPRPRGWRSLLDTGSYNDPVATNVNDDTVPPRTSDSGPPLRTLERGLSVLEALSTSQLGLSFTEIVDRTELSAGTIQRILRTLVARGYIEQDRRARTYRLGLRILELQGAIHVTNLIATQARPELHDLMRRTGRRVHLAVYRGGDRIVYIDRVDNQASIERYVPIGTGAPVYATSLGKAILAFSPPSTITEYLAHSQRTQLTPHTIVGEEELREELRRVRERGYAVEIEESVVGSCCIGAPVFDYTAKVMGAISIAGSSDEIIANLEESATIVVDHAAKISRKFGYHV